MDFNTTIDIIIRDLREAREIIDDFKNYPGVPELQVELAKSKCKSAEDIIALLKTMKRDNQDQQSGKVEKGEEVERIEVVELEEKLEITVSSAGGSQIDLFEICDEDEIEPLVPAVVEDVKEKVHTTDSNSIFKESDFEARSKPKEKLTDAPIVADQFSGLANTFNEQIGNNKGDGDISSVLKSRPVTNLNEAIGVNDKFLYIREVFNGNHSSYNEAVAKLNKVDNMADARAVIMSYTGESDENEAIKQLLDLVKRKLASDE
jgi:hypothetical protein